MGMTYWMICKSDDSCEFEIVGQTSDDTEYTRKVCLLQEMGKRARCETPPTDLSREQIIQGMKALGYQETPGLYGSNVRDIHSQ
jgi:hypothetical protein